MELIFKFLRPDNFRSGKVQIHLFGSLGNKEESLNFDELNSESPSQLMWVTDQSFPLCLNEVSAQISQLKVIRAIWALNNRLVLFLFPVTALSYTNTQPLPFQQHTFPELCQRLLPLRLCLHPECEV